MVERILRNEQQFPGLTSGVLAVKDKGNSLSVTANGGSAVDFDVRDAAALVIALVEWIAVQTPPCEECA